MTAQECELSSSGKAKCIALSELSAARREQYDWCARANRLDHLEEWTRLHHHAGPAAVRIVVDGTMAIVREITEIDHGVEDAAGFSSPSRNAETKRPSEERREDRDDVYAQYSQRRLGTRRRRIRWLSHR